MAYEDENTHVFIEYFPFLMKSLQKLGASPSDEAVRDELDFLRARYLGSATPAAVADFVLSCSYLLGGECDNEKVYTLWKDFPGGPEAALAGLYSMLLRLRGQGEGRDMAWMEEVLSSVSVSRFALLCGKNGWSFPEDMPLDEAFLADFTPGNGGLPREDEISILRDLATSCVVKGEDEIRHYVDQAYIKLEHYWEKA